MALPYSTPTSFAFAFAFASIVLEQNCFKRGYTFVHVFAKVSCGYVFSGVEQVRCIMRIICTWPAHHEDTIDSGNWLHIFFIGNDVFSTLNFGAVSSEYSESNLIQIVTFPSPCWVLFDTIRAFSQNLLPALQFSCKISTSQIVRSSREWY